VPPFPNRNTEMWVLAAMHELNTNQNIHAARTLYQRALRVNTTSDGLWLGYLELELFNVMKIRERKKVVQRQKLKDSKGQPIAAGEAEDEALSSSSSSGDALSDRATDQAAAEHHDEIYRMLHGAPLVVLRHALKAVPRDISVTFALQTLQLAREAEGRGEGAGASAYTDTSHDAAGAGATTLVRAFFLIITAHFDSASASAGASGSGGSSSSGSSSGELWQALLEEVGERLRAWYVLRKVPAGHEGEEEHTPDQEQEQISNRKRKAVAASDAAAAASASASDASVHASQVNSCVSYVQECLELIALFKKHAITARAAVSAGSGSGEEEWASLAARGATTLLLQLLPIVHSFKSADIAELSSSSSSSGGVNKKLKKGTKSSSAGNTATATATSVSAPMQVALDALDSVVVSLAALLRPKAAPARADKKPSAAAAGVPAALAFAQTMPRTVAFASFQLAYVAVRALSSPDSDAATTADPSPAGMSVAELLSGSTCTKLSMLNASGGAGGTGTGASLAVLAAAVDALAELWHALECTSSTAGGGDISAHAIAFATLSPVLVHTARGLVCYNRVINTLQAQFATVAAGAATSSATNSTNISSSSGKLYMDAIGRAYVAALTSTLMLPGSRGTLAAEYLQVAWSQQAALSAASSLSGTATSTATGAGAGTGGTSFESTLLAVQGFLDAKVLCIPALVANADIALYYTTAVEMAYQYWCNLSGFGGADSSNASGSASASAVPKINGSGKSTTAPAAASMLKYLRTYADKALELIAARSVSSTSALTAAQHDRLWQIREDVELRSGALQQASHIRWRRSRK